jgi:hypothetical protein
MMKAICRNMTRACYISYEDAALLCDSTCSGISVGVGANQHVPLYWSLSDLHKLYCRPRSSAKPNQRRMTTRRWVYGRVGVVSE